MRSINAIAAAFLAMSCAARAPAGGPTAPPLVGEMARLQFYVGDWACTGHQPGDPSADWTALVHVRPETGGSSVAVQMVGPGDNLSAELKGRDAATGAWFHVWTTRDGAHGSLTSPGWDGDALVSIDDADAHHRTIFTRVSDTRYTHRDEVDAGAGWQVQWEKTCAKRR